MTVLKTVATEAYYLTRYMTAKVLERFAGHVEGVALTRRFMDWRIGQLPAPQSPPESLRVMRDMDVPWNQADEGQDATTELRSEYELLKKVTACRIHRVLESYDDPRVMQAIACYPDFANIKRMNPSFLLTRTQDLLSGGDFCDACFHDLRGDTDLTHPSRLVFDELA